MRARGGGGGDACDRRGTMQILDRSPQGRFPYGEEIFFRCSFRVPVHPLRKRKLSPRFEKALSRPFSNLNAVPFTPTLDPIEPKSATVPECRPKHVLTKPRSFCHARRARDESIRRGSSSSPPRAQTSRRESGALGGRPRTSRRALAGSRWPSRPHRRPAPRGWGPRAEEKRVGHGFPLRGGASPRARSRRPRRSRGSRRRSSAPRS